MSPLTQHYAALSRRHFFRRGGIAAAALSSLLGGPARGHENEPSADLSRSALSGGEGAKEYLHVPPRASRVIYLFQSGGPSQLDLLDPKPNLAQRAGEEVPESIYPSERKTTMSSAQASFPTAPSMFRFPRCGQSGLPISELLPETGRLADRLCVINSMHTTAINHDPAITMLLTGSQIPGRPSAGSWIHYALGAETEQLPAFVALSSRGSGRAGQPLYDRLWGSGFLPSVYQGVKFRNQGAPVLDIYDPPGVPPAARQTMLRTLAQLNERKYEQWGDEEINTRIAQYELAGRMQASVPELLDFTQETAATLQAYGPDVQRQGSYAYNCLLARRLAERGVRFIQLFHQGWDQHNALPKQIRQQAKDTDGPTAALLRDLQSRGMLDDTLVVWGGEFGRTVYCQGKLTPENYGRDHHGHCFSVWMAGGGVRGGMRYGRTDEYSVNVVEDGMEPHDLNATILHILGIDHQRLTYPFQGRDFRLTDVHGRIIHDILS
ncbi:DUF1501 domain-containing protein [Roseimaritima sediminicola]|uniref:DUF1501 domain-containing protein n=1 Tax=Roseimaritima sediminicola TaxID=2662066 RepID=UPI0012983FDC|nr:DUF1501 domain-containing protein [Roseimaritima sediminicola]